MPLAQVDSESPTAVVPAPIVAGKYKLTRLLGRGGMGSVWEGVHTTLGTRVAVKFIDAEHAESVEARRRFENEARAAAALRSKHVVEVYDHGLMDDGRPFIVMEFLDGESLDKRLDRVGRLPPRDTARLISMICRALSKAHAVGIVHRDLKPDNIFLVWDDDDGSDVAKVVDFGIAKFTESQVPSSATRTGSVLGTPYYMSPEQARGLRTVDYRSDLWSVGIIAFRCMTGHLPFEGEAVGDVLVKLCTAALPVPSQYVPDLPPGFDAWFARALSREPEGRFQSAAELATSLASVCGLSVQSSISGDRLSGSSPHLRVQVAPATTPFGSATPSPALGAIPSPALGATPSPLLGATTPSPQVGLSAPQITGTPFTQTPAPGAVKTGKSTLLVAALILGLLVIGGGVLAKVLGGEPASASQPAAPTPTAPKVAEPSPEAREPSEVAPPRATAANKTAENEPAEQPPVQTATPPSATAPTPSARSVATAPKRPVARPVSAPPKVPARPPSKTKPPETKALVDRPPADIGF